MKRISFTFILILAGFNAYSVETCKIDEENYFIEAYQTDYTDPGSGDGGQSNELFYVMFINGQAKDATKYLFKAKGYCHPEYEISGDCKYKKGSFVNPAPAGAYFRVNWSGAAYFEICGEFVSTPTCPDGWTLEGNECVHRVAPTPVDTRTYNWSCSGSPQTHTNLAGDPMACCTGPLCP